MAGFQLSEEDHARVTAAVTKAELASDGEIVTIVADRSDGYRDIAALSAIFAMLLVPTAFAFLSVGATESLFGWTAEPVYRQLAMTIVIAELMVLALVLLLLTPSAMRMMLVPQSTRITRVRARAVQFFRTSAEKRTQGLTGILIYLSLAERRAEIVADQAIIEKVSPDIWADAMAALIEKVKAGDPAGGMVDAVEQVGAVLAEHFPKSIDNPNELPDRLIEI